MAEESDVNYEGSSDGDGLTPELTSFIARINSDFEARSATEKLRRKEQEAKSMRLLSVGAFLLAVLVALVVLVGVLS